MLKKAHRINKTRDLQKVYRQGKPTHTSALVIKFVPAARTQVAFVVSKKVSKKAVERNRIKRVLREYFRLNMEKHPMGKYMIMVKPQSASMNNQNLRLEFLKALSKVK